MDKEKKEEIPQIISEENGSPSESLKKEQKESGKSGMSRGKVFALGVSTIILICLVSTIVFFHQSIANLSQSPYTLKYADIFGIGVGTVNGHKVSYADYVSDFKILQKFYNDQSQGISPFSDEQVSNQVLSRFFINEIIGDLAERYSVSVSEEEVAEAKAALLSNFPDEAAADEQLRTQFNLSIDDYTQKVIRPILIEQKVAEAFAESEDASNEDYMQDELNIRHILVRAADPDKTDEAEKKANNIQSRITSSETFTSVADDLARETDTDVLVEDLGWVTQDAQIAPEFLSAAFGIEGVGVTPEPVETTFGFHIIHVSESRQAASFGLLMQDQIRNAEVKMLLPIANPLDSLLNDDGVLPVENIVE